MVRQGRCKAILSVAVLLVSYAAVAHGAMHIVGDAAGWVIPGTANTSITYLADWTAKQAFAAGDTVVFKYIPPGYNVLTVNEAAYTACALTSPTLRSTTGNDSLTLAAGANYYISGISGHCAKGQKITIRLSGTPTTPKPGPRPATPANPNPGPRPGTPTTPDQGPGPPTDTPSDTTPLTNNAAGIAASVFYVLAAVVVACPRY